MLILPSTEVVGRVCWQACVAALFAVLCTGWCGQASAQSVLMEWVWQPGQQLTYEMTEELEQDVHSEAMGETTDQKLNDRRVWTFEQSVTNVSEEGVATIQREYTRVRMTHDDGSGQKLSYDSDRPDPKMADHPRINPFASFVGRTIEFEVDRGGRVLRSSGGGALIRAMTEGMAGSPVSGMGLGGGLAAQMDYEEMFRRQIEQSLRIVPGKVVRRGESWDGSSEQPVPMLGSVKVDQRHTYKGTKRRGGDSLAEVQTVGRMELPDSDALGGVLSLEVENSEIESTSLLDIERGTLVESRATMLTKVSGSSPMIEGFRFEQTLRQKAELRLISGR